MTRTERRLNDRIRGMLTTIDLLRAELFAAVDRCDALEEVNVNLRVERDAADVLLAAALDNLGGSGRR